MSLIHQALLASFAAKARAVGTAIAAETAPPPQAVKERFEQLLRDAARTLRSGRMASTSGSLPGARTCDSAGQHREVYPDLTEVELIAENVEAFEEIFSTGAGADMRNEQVCRFLRHGMAAAEDYA